MQARTKSLRTGLLLAACLLAFLFGAARAQALGLGEITLSSGLNEPLDATIELLDIAGLDPSEIQVALGTQADFAQAGLEFSGLLTSIRFAVETNGTTGTIRLSTTANIAEPFLVFIVSASWPNGRQLREYTLLLDLPTFSGTPAAPAQPAVANVSPPPAQPAVGNEAPAPTPAPATTTATPSPTPGAEDTYAVGAGDTLWEIAESTRPGSVSLQQMMVAIQRANEDAFIGNNINQLRSGRVLRIPSLQEITVIEQDAAIAQINLQSSTLGGQPLAVNNTGAAGGGTAEQDELTVLSGDQNVSAGAGSSDLAATIAALETELMLSEESLDRARLENLELTNRLASLEEEIDLLRNIIAIEDQRIAQLQSELTQQTAATAQALAQLQTANQTNAPAAPAGLGGLLQNTAVLIGGLLALVLAVLGVLVVRRRRAEAEADMHAYNPALNPAVAAAPQQDFADDEPAGGFLAGLLARFRRPREDEGDEGDNGDEDHFDGFDADQAEDYQADAIPPAAAVTASVSSKPLTSNKEPFSDMELEDDLSSLDNILDDIDETGTHGQDETGTTEFDLDDTTDDALDLADADLDEVDFADADPGLKPSAPVQEPSALMEEPSALMEEPSALMEEPSALMEEPSALMEDPSAQAEDSAEPEVGAAPEAFEFNLRDVPAEPAVGTSPAAHDDEPEVEAFEFTPQAPFSAVGTTRSVAEEPAPDVEVISFNTSPAPAEAEPEVEEIIFDDTMLSDEVDDAPVYKSRVGQDEFDTKLDLATAFEAMGDVDDALEILDEVIAEGNPAQVELAKRLQQSWRSA